MDLTDRGESLKSLLEGLVFTSGEEGLSVLQIQSVLDWCDRSTLENTLEELAAESRRPERGIELVRYGGHWKYVAKESVYPFAQRLYAKIRNSSLSSSALEVLSLIAYKGPITRVEIDDIRGVSSDMMIKKLQARGLVESAGHLETVGRPILYKVGAAFFDAMGIDSLEDLPSVSSEDRKDSDGDLPALFENLEEIE